MDVIGLLNIYAPSPDHEKYTLNITFSPQRSFNTRTSFYFDLENRSILVSYKKGKEKVVRTGGEYISKFIEEQEEKYIVRLDFIEDDSKKHQLILLLGTR
ncbi:hypothetical protein [Vreelandella sp. H-I2]